MKNEYGMPKQVLAGMGLLLALVALNLLVAGVVDALPLSPEQAVASYRGNGLRSEPESGASAASTAFLPLVLRGESAANVWLAEYYDNGSLNGVPVRTVEEKRIDYDWEEDAPPGLPDNYFSIRWTGMWDFDVGDYTFFVYSDDGVRLWLDGVLVIDAWSPGMGEHDETVRVVVAGPHSVKIEYYESRGDAAIRVRWHRTDLFPVWSGDYYDNPWVEGNSRFSQEDAAIQFDWDDGCPEDLPPNSCNRFSIAWEAEPVFEVGTHRIHLYADEGYRLDVEGGPEADDGWYEGQSSEDDYYDFDVTSIETRQISFDFHDQGGPAEARLWIVNLVHPLWTAEYYSNRNLTGTPDLTREEIGRFP